MSLEKRAESDTPEPRDLQFQRKDWPFYWIIRISSRYFLKMDAKLKSIGLDVISWRVLMAVYEDKQLSVSELADACVIRVNTTTRVVQRMVLDDLVSVSPLKSDRRVTMVSITKKGEQLRHQGWEIAQQMLSKATGQLNGDEQRQLVNDLRGILKRLEE